MYKRSVESILKVALDISPVVLLTGARQVGKSTLCIELDNEYRVFDNLSEREAAYNDPIGYINTLPKPITIDEIQKVPQVLEAIKLEVDKNRINGNYVLTGSANVLDMKSTKDTLAGRVVEIKLSPLSQKELHHKPDDNLIDNLFKSEISSLQLDKDISISHILEGILNGGYPEIQKIKSTRSKTLWFNSYISTYVEKDIRDVGELRDISAFIRFFNILAPRSSGILNKSDLANDASLSEATINNYLSMLEMIYQILLLNPYSSNISKRFIKSPKFYMNDSGVLSHLLGITSIEELQSSDKKGEIIETFVYSELLKHINYSDIPANIYHYRTNDKKEIDFILEYGQKIIAIEVKSSQSIKQESFKHIADFQKKSKQEILGIVFYMGDKILPFGDETYKRFAVPIKVFF